MKLNCETILDFYTHKNRKILCQIKVTPKNRHLENNCRFLTPEHWKAFDNEMEKVIATIDDWNAEMCLKFIIKPYIQVKVHKSSLRLKNFYKCFGAIEGCANVDESQFANFVEPNFVLECIFDFQQDVKFASSVELKENYPHIETSLDSLSCSPLSHVPYTGSETNNEANKIDTAKALDNFFLEYDKETNSENSNPKVTAVESLLTKNYKPSSTKIQRDSIKKHKKQSKEKYAFLELVENIKENHTSKEDCPRKVTSELSVNMKSPKSISKMVIVNTKPYRKVDKADKTLPYRAEESKDANVSRIKEKFTLLVKKSESSLNKEEKAETRIESDNVFENSNKLDINVSQKSIENTSNSKTPISFKSKTDACLQEVIQKERNTKASNIEITKSIRRSKRSPTKPKRFIEDYNLIIKKKTKKHKSSIKSRELFLTDGDEDDYFENNNGGDTNVNKIKSLLPVTPVNNKSFQCNSSSTPSSIKNKRKEESSSCECEQEKRDMSKWLSKKKLAPSDKEVAKLLKAKAKIKSSKAYVDSNSKILDTPISLELPSKKELELIRNKTKLIQKENAIVRAELDKMLVPPPKEVEILSLQNISANEILNTFVMYKSELDEIYKNNHRKDYIKGHDGINHCFVIRLLQQNVQMKMLEKLTEVYSSSNTTAQVTLFANALLPEWIIRVYMEKFNFTRQQAISQIKAQEEFQLHMEEQSDNTFMFD